MKHATLVLLFLVLALLVACKQPHNSRNGLQTSDHRLAVRPFSVKQDVLGDSFETYSSRAVDALEHECRKASEFTKPNTQGVAKCTDYNLNDSGTYAGATYKFKTVRFADRKLFKIEYVFRESLFSSLGIALSARYGKPTSDVTNRVHNRFGAEFDNETLTWDNAVSSITLEQRGVAVDFSVLTFVHKELETAVARRAAEQGLRKAMKDM